VEAEAVTAVLEFIHARKWLVELILLLAIVGGVWWFCQHLIGVGVQRQKDTDAAELVKLQHDADIKTAQAQERADIAEKANAKEATDLDVYRRLHPEHGGLCLNQRGRDLPQAGAANSGNAGAAAGAGDVQPLLPGDSGPGGQGDPDIRGMLEALYARADLLSAQVREYQAH
jgi:hypothetical protein